jgi:integrase
MVSGTGFGLIHRFDRGRGKVTRKHAKRFRPALADAHPWTRYPGLHTLRHFYASWCINRRAEVVQGRLGHASIQMTVDRYGHFFPRGDDGAELAAAEKMLLGS